MSVSLKAYKTALRATRIAFKNDDPVLNAARTKIREGFLENKYLIEQSKIDECVKNINDVSRFLVENIVQGEKQDSGKFFLNFHDKTELGDNETIKQNNKANLGTLAGAKTKKYEDIKK